MTKFESRTGKVNSTEEYVYQYLSNFDNFKDVIPQDEVKDFRSDEDSCSFTIDTIGQVGLRIVEKEPCKLIKISSDENTKYEFYFWIQIKQAAEKDTRVKLTIKANLNPMVKIIASRPLQMLLDKLIDRIETFDFNIQ